MNIHNIDTTVREEHMRTRIYCHLEAKEDGTRHPGSELMIGGITTSVGWIVVHAKEMGFKGRIRLFACDVLRCSIE